MTQVAIAPIIVKTEQIATQINAFGLACTFMSNGIDFAIDDGPHSLASQQRFLELYLPLLNDGGIAVIEDIQDYSWFDSLIPLVSEDYTYEIIDLRGVKGRYDDLMLVVYK